MTRKDDHTLLNMLDMHRQGYTSYTIGKAVRMNHMRVEALITDVIVEDCAHDPEAVPYWNEDDQ